MANPELPLNGMQKGKQMLCSDKVEQFWSEMKTL
jgi:hypothetical protein